MFLNHNVLLADDHTPSRQQLREILRVSGLGVAGEAQNTDDALDKFERLRPEVVIMDVTLFGTMNPLVVIQRMKRMEPDVTIFATATASQSNVVMEALSMGAADFFLKPYQQRTVRSCLERNML